MKQVLVDQPVKWENPLTAWNNKLIQDIFSVRLKTAIDVKVEEEPKYEIEFVGKDSVSMWLRDANSGKTIGKFCPHKNCTNFGCLDCDLVLEGQDD